METNSSLSLEKRPEGLTLTDGKLTMCGDLTTMLPRLRQHNLNSEMLVKAAKIKDPSIPHIAVDATAGMGEDSLLLAAHGYEVYLYEKDEVIAALLMDSVERAKKEPELKDIVERMHVFSEDSIEAMKKLPFKPDIILLDPMFPAREKSGLIKKKFQLLQQLERPCNDEEELLNAALMAKPSKIIIKRPAKGPFLAGRKPSYSVNGNSIRYDCIVL